MRKFTMRQFRDRMIGLSKKMDKTVLPPIRKEVKELRKKTRSGYIATGIGRDLWRGRKKPGKPRLVLKSSTRWSRTENAYVGSLKAVGMAALLEQGGRTRDRRRLIRPKNAEALAFSVGGGTIFSATVRHKGAILPKTPILQEAVRGRAGPFTNSVTAALDKLLRETF